MKITDDIKSSITSAILLFTLASTVAYVFAEESIFRPPNSRSRAGMGSSQNERERRTEEVRETFEKPAGRRLQSKEWVLFAK